MWNIITDCGKQITVLSTVRERVGNSFLLYKIIEVESDQYKLELVNRNNMPVAEKIHNVLDCQQLVQYHFEVEEPELVGKNVSLANKT